MDFLNKCINHNSNHARTELISCCDQIIHLTFHGEDTILCLLNNITIPNFVFVYQLTVLYVYFAESEYRHKYDVDSPATTKRSTY